MASSPPCTTSAEPFDTDALPPTQYLVLEVLAARARTGDDLWPFSSRLAVPLRALEDAGLVSVMHGVVANTIRARLTAAGRAAALSETYEPPRRLLPEGTTTEEQWAVRWTWPDGATDESDCPATARHTGRERAEHRAAAHTHQGIAGEVLRRYVHTTPDEVVATYPAAVPPEVPDGE